MPGSERLVIEHGDRQVRLVAHRLAARRDRVHARREWAQRGDQVFGLPARRELADEIDELVVAEQAAQRVLAVDAERAVEFGVLSALRVRGDERLAELRDLAFAQQPLAQRGRLVLQRDTAFAVELERDEQFVDEPRGIRRPYAERVAGLVRELRALE